MVIDTSALVAILAGEPESDEFNTLIAEAGDCSMTAATYAETHIVIDARYGGVGTRELSLFLIEAQVQVVPVDRDLADLARFAYRRYGRGRDKAQLNFGDTFSYALAKRTGQPLLFKGSDFEHTDVLPARVKTP
jgi:ribonuclease VapC